MAAELVAVEAVQVRPDVDVALLYVSSECVVMPFGILRATQSPLPYGTATSGAVV